jgi:Domain of unknown function (DUF4326)
VRKDTLFKNPRVLNRAFSSYYGRYTSIYVGRPTKWGNPYGMGLESRRDLVCDQYDQYIATRLINDLLTEKDFKELEGKNLMCFCAPKRCHADTLLKLAAMTHKERLNWAHEKVSTV